MKHWPFAKYVGCGNDFILFDNRTETFPIFSRLIRQLCHRQQGIGADGLLLLGNSILADFSVRIFNADGSEAEMCGNGLRCLVKWLIHLGFDLPLFRIEVMQSVLSARQKQNDIYLEMPNPKNIQWNLVLPYENQSLRLHYLNTGVPHAVIFVKDIENTDIFNLGTFVRNHPFFKPQGTNATFVEELDNKKLKIRTFERGVEGETLACGTGATAAALAAAQLRKLKGPISVATRSGEELVIDFRLQNQEFADVTLTGPAKCTFMGEVELSKYTQIT